MKLFYFRSSYGNFGDDINPYIWTKLIPDVIDGDDDAIFLGIGTILNRDLVGDAIATADEVHVFGSGAGYGTLPDIDDRWTVHCVRGPLTAQKLELSPDTAVTDPAVLVRLFVEQSTEKHHEVSFMPHVGSLLHALTVGGITLWEWGCRAAGIHFIDPRDPVQKTLTAIQQSRLLIAEAMHGAIVADALRVPWIPIRFHEHILPFKWRDWCASLNMSYDPVTPGRLLNLAPPAESTLFQRIRRNLWPFHYALRLRQIATNVEPNLSDRGALEAAIDKLYRLASTMNQ